MAREPTDPEPVDPETVGYVRLDPLAKPPARADRTYRRAALISTAVAVPVAILAALAFTAGGTGGTNSSSASAAAELPALTVPAIPPNPAADSACSKVFAALPVTLNGLSPRVVRSQSTFVVAWGQPPVILSCGVPRPAGLVPNSGDLIVDIASAAGQGVEWLPAQARNGSTTLTSIDRSVYLQVQLPKTVAQSPDVMPALSGAIASALPAICQAVPNPYPTNPDPNLEKTYCVNRK